uniref:Ig-like domain-containing protein n=1 Tax=Macrostomum lignano TaxID=282301 RepID=A0A1I8J6S7_9PLAT
MPAGLTESPLDCIASFNHSLIEFHLCGVTGNFGNSNFSYKVTCATRDYSKLPRFVLLRKFVANAADKYMNFVMVELEEDEQDEAQESGCFREYFCKPEGRQRCSVEQLSDLTQNDKVMVKESLPCHSDKPDSVNCSIRTRSGDVTALSIKTYRPSFLILNDITMTWDMHGASLQCRHSCTDEVLAVTSQTLGLRGWKSIKIPSSIQLNLGFTKYWVVNSTAVFTFITQGSFPMPVHKCSVALSVSNSFNSAEELKAKSEKLITRSSNASFDLVSYFSVPVSLSYQNGTVYCSIECNSQTITTVSAEIPEIKKPCITRFLLPPDSSWTDGATVNLTADSYQGNWVTTSHSCFLQSEGVPNSTLRIV